MSVFALTVFFFFLTGEPLLYDDSQFGGPLMVSDFFRSGAAKPPPE